jgi:hypothetical protein
MNTDIEPRLAAQYLPKIEEEFRSQNSGVRINQSGIQRKVRSWGLPKRSNFVRETGAGLKTTKFSCFVGVLNPIIHPPVIQNSYLFSDS